MVFCYLKLYNGLTLDLRPSLSVVWYFAFKTVHLEASVPFNVLCAYVVTTLLHNTQNGDGIGCGTFILTVNVEVIQLY